MLVSIVVGVVSTGVVVVVVAVELVVADVVDVVVVVGAVDSSLLNQPECLLISIHLWVGAEDLRLPYINLTNLTVSKGPLKFVVTKRDVAAHVTTYERGNLS